ncbi:MAG: M48 family metalloprotease [Candidatus Omnitrophica bacterium]|nr:M48 family metalloprotease [Candidatus Omnitrophota bacterium]
MGKVRVTSIFFRKTQAVFTTLVFALNCIIVDNARAIALPIVKSDAIGKLNDIDQLVIPYGLGSVKDMYKGPSDRSVILIQDAHCEYSCQQKIAGLLEYLNSGFGVDRVNLEGGSENYDLSIFTGIRDKTVRHKVSDQFVRDGTLSGSEFFAVNSVTGIELWGIEDVDLYMKNLAAYRGTLNERREVSGKIEKIQSALNGLKEHIYSGEFLALDSKNLQYRSEKISFKEYIEYLYGTASSKKIPIPEYPNLALLSETIQGESKLDFKKAGIERDTLIDTLKNDLSKGDLKTLLQMTVELKEGKISEEKFYGELTDKAKYLALDMAKYQELVKYTEYVSAYKSIDKYEVSREIRELENRIKSIIASSAEEKELDILSGNIETISKLAEFKLTVEEYVHFRDNRETFNIGRFMRFIRRECPKYGIVHGIPEDIYGMEGHLDKASEFYSLGFERDEAFMRNIRFSPSGSGELKRIAVVVTGGFHGENLGRIFRDNGISYATIMPEFIIGKDDVNRYFDLLAGKWSGIQESLYKALVPASNMQIASILSEKIAARVWEEERITAFEAAVLIRERLGSEKIRLLVPGGEVIELGNGDKINEMTLESLCAELSNRERGVSPRMVTNAVSNIESMQVQGGVNGSWVRGEDLSAHGNMGRYKKLAVIGAAGTERAFTVKGVELVIDFPDKDMEKEYLDIVKNAVTMALGEMDERDFARLLEAQGKRKEGLKPILVTILDGSKHLFEDHTANGFIGVNGKLFNKKISPGTIGKTLQIGFAHELSHEALIGERAILVKNTGKSSEDIDNLSAEEIITALTPQLKDLMEGDLFELDIDKAIDLGMSYEEALALANEGILSPNDGFLAGLSFHGNKRLRSRVREFLAEYDLKNHLIDGADPEYMDVYGEIRAVFDKLLETAGYNPKFFHLYFSDEEEANAFYLNGSNVFVVNLGLLKLSSENGKVKFSKDAIAFILAHELQHLRQYYGDVGSGKIDPNAELKPRWSGWDTMTEEQKKAYAKENDADWKAVSLMSEAGFNVTEASAIFRLLLKEMTSGDTSKQNIYVPFGAHPQLEPRTLELEELVNNRYWPNSSRDISMFPDDLMVKTSRFRGFQKRAINVSSDKDFALFIKEARDIRELSLAVSMGKSRRSEPGYEVEVPLGDPEAAAWLTLHRASDSVRAWDNSARKEVTKEGYKKNREAAAMSVKKELEAIGPILAEIEASRNTQNVKFDTVGGWGTQGMPMPWGEKMVFIDSGVVCADILTYAGSAYMVVSSALTANEEIVTVQISSPGDTVLIPLKDLFRYRKATILKEKARISPPLTLLKAISERINALIEADPDKEAQLKFYEEMFKKYLFRSEKFSERAEETKTEFNRYTRKIKDNKVAIADRSEFQRFVGEYPTAKLISAVEGLLPVWISLDGVPWACEREYHEFKETLEGQEVREPYFVRGDYTEFIDAVAGEIIARVERGDESRETLIKFAIAMEKAGKVAYRMRGGISDVKLKVLTAIVRGLRADSGRIGAREIEEFVQLLDKMKLLEGANTYWRDADKSVDGMKEEVAAVLYDAYQSYDTKDAVVGLFRKHNKLVTGLKDSFFSLLNNDKHKGLRTKLDMLVELGEDGRSFWDLKGVIMNDNSGESDAFTDCYISEITGKQGSLSFLREASPIVKRLVVLTYLGTFDAEVGLLFEIYDRAGQRLRMNAEDMDALREFLEADVSKTEKSFSFSLTLVKFDSRRQLALLLRLFRFLEEKGREDIIGRFLRNIDFDEALGSGMPKGEQYTREMGTFSMFFGELLMRYQDDLQAEFNTKVFGMASKADSDQGFSADEMVSRLNGSRVQRFARWDIMHEGDKDHIGYFAFLPEIFEGRSFKESADEIAVVFQEGFFRNMMLYSIFIKKILNEKLGIDVPSGEMFDFPWMENQIRGHEADIRDDLKYLLKYMAWDSNIQRLNVRYLAQSSKDPYTVDDAAYALERPGYTDIEYYDIGGRESQLSLNLAGLDSGHIADSLVGRNIKDQLDIVLEYYPLRSLARDKYLANIFSGTIRDIRSGNADFSASAPEMERALKEFQNISSMEKFAVQALEESLKDISKKKNSPVSFKEELDEIKRFLSGHSYVRDEVLTQFTNRQVKTSREYAEIAHLFVQDPDNVRDKGSSEYLFWKEQMQTIILNMDVTEKKDLLLWLMDIKGLPLSLKNYEFRLGVNFDGFKNSFGLFEGEFYKGVGRKNQEEILNSLFLGDNGIFSDPASYDEFVEKIVSKLIRPSKNALKELLKGVLTTGDPGRRMKVLMGVLKNYDGLSKIESTEEQEAVAVRVFLEANGLVGIKLGQFLVHSAFVEKGTILQKELDKLKDSVAPINKGIVFDMLEKIYKGKAFEEHFESLDEILGSASIKVVYKATRKDGKKVVIKIKRPEVDKLIDRDLKFLSDMLNRFGPMLEKEGLTIPPGLEERLKGIINEELNFGTMDKEGAGEANNQVRMRRNMESRKTREADGAIYEFSVPNSVEVYDNALMVEEFAMGVPLKKTDELRASGVETDKVQELIMEELLMQFFVDGFYHADLHSGNVLVDKTAEKTFIRIIDIGAAAVISEDNRMRLIGMLSALWDKDKWDIGKQIIYEYFPQFAGNQPLELELRSIVDSELNPVQKLIVLFGMLEKNGIDFKGEFREFYSVIRFLKASEYLFTDKMLEMLKKRFFPANIDELKRGAVELTQEVRKNFGGMDSPAVTEVGTEDEGLEITFNIETLQKAKIELDRLKQMRYWSTIVTPFPQVADVVDLCDGIISYYVDSGTLMKMKMDKSEREKYEDIREMIRSIQDIIINQGVGPFSIIKIMRLLGRIGKYRNDVIDYILKYYVPVKGVLDHIKLVRGISGAGESELGKLLERKMIEKIDKEVSDKFGRLPGDIVTDRKEDRVVATLEALMAGEKKKSSPIRAIMVVNGRTDEEIEKMERTINKGLAANGFGSADKKCKREICLINGDDETYKDKLMEEVRKAERSLPADGKNMAVTVFAPEIISAEISAFVAGNGLLNTVKVIKDGYTDSDLDSNRFPDIMSRYAIARNIFVYYNTNAQDDALAAINKVLSQVTAGNSINNIEDLFNIILMIKPVDFKEITEWQDAMTEIATSL